MSSSKDKPLAEILGVDPVIRIVDVGASPVDGPPRYQPFLDQDRARVVGFEPDADALARLNQTKGAHETYLPHAIGDGAPHVLHVCQASGMSSLFEPNAELLDHYTGLPDWGRVLRTQAIDTRRLDDIAETADMDFLKLDIQGAELMALQHAQSRLVQCMVIHCEVLFLPMYLDQPLFTEIEGFLRGQGFWFHKFDQVVSPVLKPLKAGGVNGGLSQAFWADAVFVRDFTDLAHRPPVKLLAAAAILHDLYKSWDLALHFLTQHDRQAGTSHAGTYAKILTG